jgi:hypothetical protein
MTFIEETMINFLPEKQNKSIEGTGSVVDPDPIGSA